MGRNVYGIGHFFLLLEKMEFDIHLFGALSYHLLRLRFPHAMLTIEYELANLWEKVTY